MARSGKRRRRKQRQRQRKQSSGPASPDKMLQLGRVCLRDLDARNALTHLKAAVQAGGASPQLQALLWAASMVRAEQLDRTAPKDAAQLRKTAERYVAALEDERIEDEDLALVCRQLELGEAVRLYGRRAAGDADALPHTAGVLADRVLVRCDWQAVTSLEPELPLRCDAPHARLAVPAMDAGDWERADATLAVLSRTSPFARWRVFSKAMASFAAEDDDGLAKALRLLPADFCMRRTVQELRLAGDATTTAERSARQARAAQLMWRGSNPARASQLGRDLVDAVRRRRTRDLPAIVEDLAQAVCPEHIEAARATLVELVGLGVLHDGLSRASVFRLAEQLLPPGRAALVCAKIGVWAQKPSHDTWDLEPAIDCLERLDKELSDSRQQSLARAQLLEHVARSGHDGDVCLGCAGAEVERRAYQLAGRRPDERGQILAELMAKSLEADPDNREGYDFFVDLARECDYPRDRLEKVLLRMRDRFAADPAACLQLATSYYARNAFRKAEAEIEEACRRAPHDAEILDMRAIGYLRTGDEQRKRKKYKQAAAQVAKAAGLNRSTLAQVVEVKRIAVRLLDEGDSALPELQQVLDSLPPIERLRFLALLLADLPEGDTKKRRRAPIRDRVQTLADESIAAIGELTREQIAELAAPLPPRLELLFSDRRVAPSLEALWVDLLARARSEDLGALLDVLIDGCGRATLGQVVREAAAQRDAPSVLLHFARVILQDLEEPGSSGESLRAIADSATAAEQEDLKKLAAKLAEKTHGTLAAVLRSFELEVLDAAGVMMGGASSAGELFDRLRAAVGALPEGAGPDWDSDDQELLEEEVRDFEEFIDEQGLRGAPDSLIRRTAADMRADPRTRADMDGLAEDVADSGLAVSRELSILLFRKKKSRPKRRMRLF